MRALDKKLMRDIWRSRGQALAVISVVLCGTASYITMASAYRNLLLTRDTYYSEYRFADFTIMMERAPLTAVYKIEALAGVREARGRTVEDVKLDIDGQDEPRIGRVISMPSHAGPVINGICLLTGRYFETGTANEVIVSDAFAKANGLDVGSRFLATIENRKHALRVVGTALSPEYVYMSRNPQDFIPSPERFGILWVPQTFAEMAFDMQSACNEVVGVVENEERLDAILDEAEKLLDSYGVFAKVKRHDQMSNRYLSDEIAGLGVSARIIPTIFLGIAALILLVLLSRMVRQERTQIGLLKAFGYSDAAVSAHYLKFALVLGAAGCVGGFVVGEWLADGMMRMYKEFFQFPLLRSRVYPDVVAKAALITMVSASFGALGAARAAAAIRPAEAMRPRAPRHAHRTLIERVGVIWRNLTFTSKMIVRNVARYRLRAALTVFGVMISAGIMIVGFFTMDSMMYMLEFQFSETQREDVKVTLRTELGKDALYEMRRMDYVREAEPLLQYPFEIRSRWRKKDTAIMGLSRDSDLMRLMDSRGRFVDVGDSGLVLPDRLARDLGVGAGDTVTLKPLMGRIKKEKNVVVRKVVRQYLGATGYMNLDSLSRLLDEPFAMNAALIRTDNGRERDLNRGLKDVAAVSAVEIKQDSYKSILATLAESMNITNTIMAVFSGVIAFAIIYNSTIVSLAERQRELASLRVMGFTTGEVGRIVYNENFLLSALGLLLGFPFGIAQCKLIVHAYDTELYRLPFHIEPATFVKTAALTILFVVLANLAVRHKVRSLDMVEVLKARE